MFAWNIAKKIKLKVPTLGKNEEEGVKLEIPALLDDLAKNADTWYLSFCYISLKERFNALMEDMNRLKQNNIMMQKCIEDICREDFKNDGETDADIKVVYESED